jgi:hypothetical protein
MELKNLTQEELVNINGGDEATNSFWTLVGLVARGFWEFAQGSPEGGYAYAKTGMY